MVLGLLTVSAGIRSAQTPHEHVLKCGITVGIRSTRLNRYGMTVNANEYGMQVGEKESGVFPQSTIAGSRVRGGW